MVQLVHVHHHHHHWPSEYAETGGMPSEQQAARTLPAMAGGEPLGLPPLYLTGPGGLDKGAGVLLPSVKPLVGLAPLANAPPAVLSGHFNPFPVYGLAAGTPPLGYAPSALPPLGAPGPFPSIGTPTSNLVGTPSIPYPPPGTMVPTPSPPGAPWERPGGMILPATPVHVVPMWGAPGPPTPVTEEPVVGRVKHPDQGKIGEETPIQPGRFVGGNPHAASPPSGPTSVLGGAGAVRRNRSPRRLGGSSSLPALQPNLAARIPQKGGPGPRKRAPADGLATNVTLPKLWAPGQPHPLFAA